MLKYYCTIISYKMFMKENRNKKRIALTGEQQRDDQVDYLQI
jgi:hypothetical protein